MRMQPLAAMGLVMVVVSVGGCGRNVPTVPDTDPTATPSALASTDVLVRGLEGQGIRVVRVEEMARQSHPYFSVPATRLSVSGENVYAFEYASAQAADRDARLIAPDGYGVGNAHIDWIGPPRYYKKDQLIVLYVGSNPAVVGPLERLLGDPVAGR